jgi:hypothetical protein
MKLTDQEQVILKAIGNGVAEVSRVIKAVGYPKATVKKVLVKLNEKGIVSLHRHDWPQSLKPEQRKLMVKIGSNYYNAVSVMKRNPKSKGKTALKKTGRALKGFTRGALSAGAQILGAGAEALNPVRRKIRNKYIDLVIKGQAKKTPQGWQVGKKTFVQGRGTVSVSSGYYLDKHTGLVYAKRERNKSRRKNVEMGFYDASGFHPIRASSDYSEGQRPSRSKRAKATKRKATATASHKRKVSSRKATRKSLASRSLRRTTSTGKRLKRKRNISEGFYDASGTFHPIRSATDYSPSAAGETGRQPRRTRSKKKVSAKRKASSTARRRSMVARRKKTTSRLASRAIKKSSGLLKAKRRGRKRNNPSAESIRKTFAGRVGGERDVFLPKSAPSGKFAKLGRLVSITTEKGTIKPIHGSAVLLADTTGKLHIGSLTGANLIDGPARSFGQVKKIEYDESKPHLGYGPTIWFHHMGEESGHRPTLYADGKGGLVFRGGRYRLTSRGIEN